jgi:uncharacterized protein YbjT (DUF2867 family)
MSTVLVTGGSGFVGSHVVLQLLNAQHEVRTTVRSLERADVVRALLKDAGKALERLSFFVADLVHDEGWAEAVAGCEYVMHVASPMPPKAPKSEDELIVPAPRSRRKLARQISWRTSILRCNHSCLCLAMCATQPAPKRSACSAGSRARARMP